DGPAEGGVWAREGAGPRVGPRVRSAKGESLRPAAKVVQLGGRDVRAGEDLPMTAALLALLLSWGEPPPLAGAKARPGGLSLLEGEEQYRKAAGPEATLEGTVERTPTPGRVEPAARFNLFRLRTQDAGGREDVRELHVPGKAYLVASHVGKKVRVRGKLVETTAGGRVHRELWPAWLEPLTGALAERPGGDGGYARCAWQPDEARAPGARKYVFRSGEELARALRVSGPSAGETATELLARRLRVPALDWKKHMLVCVSAGLQGPAVEGLVIVRAARRGG